ncbi:MAG: hypothetical protein PWQ97_479 [Tepidanaerobacteraceae bacterium]|nr:hypothetical protein [Tepidanaerobacteraceae bacterium]
MSAKRLTQYGVEVKKRLLDLKMTQQEFCDKYGIPKNRFSEILYGIKPGNKYRAIINRALQIGEDEEIKERTAKRRCGKL